MSEQPTDQAPVIQSDVQPGVGMVGLTPLAQQYLDETRPWVRFISILTFLTAGFMLVVGLGLLAFSVLGGLAAGSQRGPGALGGAVAGAMLAVVYVVMAFVYLAPGMYLFRYASAIAHLRGNASAAALEQALKQQKSFWRVVGILTAIGLVVGIAVGVVAMVAGIIAAVVSAH